MSRVVGSPGHSWLRAGVHAAMLVLLFGAPARAGASHVDPGTPTVQLSGPDVKGVLPTGVALTFDASAATVGTYEECEDQSSGVGCSSASCKSPKSTPYATPIDATIASASCDDPRCTATFDANAGTVAITVTAPATVNLTVTMTTSEGRSVVGVTPLTFATPRAIVLTTDEPARLSAKDAFLPNQRFQWCASLVGENGEKIETDIGVETSGAVALVGGSPHASIEACVDVVTAVTPGAGVVKVSAAGLTRDVDIVVARADEVTGVDFVLAGDPGGPTSIDVSQIAQWQTLEGTYAPSATEVCNHIVLVAARFALADGRFGLVASSSITAMGSAVPVDSFGEPVVQLYGGDRATTSLLTVSIGEQSAALDVVMPACPY